MKELSIEQKAKTYDEVIKKAETLYKASEPMSGCNVLLETLFPELKESEDEKIRKELLQIAKKSEDSFYMVMTPDKRKHLITWLEKQGEFKNIDSDDLATLETWEDAVKENKEKWQLSDWFVEATSLLIQKVKRIENNESINIKGSKVMLNACINALRAVGHSHLSDWLEKQEQKPADSYCQENCKGFQETGKCFADGECKAKREAEQKTAAWSEEDDYNLQCCIAKVQNDIDNGRIGRNRELLTWLKSLKLRSQWRPSDEQMEALDDAIAICSERDYETECMLDNLRQDLKKVRG